MTCRNFQRRIAMVMAGYCIQPANSRNSRKVWSEYLRPRTVDQMKSGKKWSLLSKKQSKKELTKGPPYLVKSLV